MREARSDPALLAGLRSGDEDAFVEIVERYHSQLVRLATVFVSGRDTAEDIAQETWLALLTGLDRFEGRSMLRTWLFQICANRARSTGEREHRTVPVDLIGPALERAQFTDGGAWSSPPTPWPGIQSRFEDDADMVAAIRFAIQDLPPIQQLVVTLRDVEGRSAEEVCNVLSLSASNQRVLLHRGRTHIRDAISGAVIGQ